MPSELTAAFLWAQLENLDVIQLRRKAIWEDYYNVFSTSIVNPMILGSYYLERIKSLKFKVEKENQHNLDKHKFDSSLNISTLNFKFKGNYHLFYLLFPNLESRTAYAAALKEQGILSVFHYQSLHRSEFAKRHFPDQYQRDLPNSDYYSDCLLRLPLFYELPELCSVF
ncbi:DegT/DnrJ/EryC1/StrS family aminotransferase [Algoriphagus halophilus]|uniref:DegT/DnrJ/EryC1/StrS family aminotransferase n=1 Tax=Algoriphagus halophilus TaxID=226505 RepID=UPI00358E22B6